MAITRKIYKSVHAGCNDKRQDSSNCGQTIKQFNHAYPVH